MPRPKISADDLRMGSGNFNEYMKWVAEKLERRYVDPKTAAHHAAQLVTDDGHVVHIGSSTNDAGKRILEWMDEYYGERAYISYCLPRVTAVVRRVPYLMRLHAIPNVEMPMSAVFEGLSTTIAQRLDVVEVQQLEALYNRFDTHLRNISRFSTFVTTQLESAATHLVRGKSSFGLSRYESSMFVELAMKEILEPLGRSIANNKGHRIENELHKEWMAAGFPALPDGLLERVRSDKHARYNRAYPFDKAMDAHHVSIELVAKIADALPPIEPFKDGLSLRLEDVELDSTSAITRVMLSLSPRGLGPVRLTPL